MKTVRFSDQPRVRFVHFSDLHYGGERNYLRRVVDKINALAPDFACFTGDIVEDRAYLEEALGELSRITCPVYGVPGNHDYWSGAAFDDIRVCMNSTGGAWLTDDRTTTPDRRCLLEGWTLRATSPKRAQLADTNAPPGQLRILLVHYPAQVHDIKDARYDLILAGHSHGGQVRLPFIGAPVLPYLVGEYEAGRYDTPAGPLYVNVGIGTFYLHVRFLCCPELTVIEL